MFKKVKLTEVQLPVIQFDRFTFGHEPLILIFIFLTLIKKIYRRVQMAGKANYGHERVLDNGTISLLINSAYYFIESVFILRWGSHYRLVAVHDGKILVDSLYDSVRGARVAFAKLFRDKAWSDEIKPEWSLFYEPEDSFYRKAINGIN